MSVTLSAPLTLTALAPRWEVISYHMAGYHMVVITWWLSFGRLSYGGYHIAVITQPSHGYGVHIGPKSLILAPQEILDISGYQWGFGRQFVKAYNNENPVTNQKIL